MPSSKRFHGWTKRRFLPFGSAFCGLTPKVATHYQGILFWAVVCASLGGPAGIIYREAIARSRINADAFSGMNPP